jgi:hypothetical protein
MLATADACLLVGMEGRVIEVLKAPAGAGFELGKAQGGPVSTHPKRSPGAPPSSARRSSSRSLKWSVA